MCHGCCTRFALLSAEELSLEEVDGGLLDGMGAQPEDDAAVRLKVVICEGKNRQVRGSV